LVAHAVQLGSFVDVLLVPVRFHVHRDGGTWTCPSDGVINSRRLPSEIITWVVKGLGERLSL